jgi:hypothetical protein
MYHSNDLRQQGGQPTLNTEWRVSFTMPAGGMIFRVKSKEAGQYPVAEDPFGMFVVGRLFDHVQALRAQAPEVEQGIDAEGVSALAALSQYLEGPQPSPSIG